MQIKQVSTLNIDDTIEVFYKPNSKITDYLGPSIVWKVIAKNHSGYPNGSVTLMSSKGIASLPFDAKEPNNTDLYIRDYGNNRWKFSNIRQWLNSDKKGGSGGWYTAQHQYDASPENSRVFSKVSPTNSSKKYYLYEYYTFPGFLYDMDKTFVNSVLSTTLNTATYRGFSNNTRTETTKDKFFLLSATEYTNKYHGSSISDGTYFDYFDNHSVMTLAYLSGWTNYISSLFSSPDTINSVGALYTSTWTRSAYDEISYSVYHTFNSDTRLSTGNPINGTRAIRPVCNIPQLGYVTKDKNKNGHYEFLGLIQPKPI